MIRVESSRSLWVVGIKWMRLTKPTHLLIAMCLWTNSCKLATYWCVLYCDVSLLLHSLSWISGRSLWKTTSYFLRSVQIRLQLIFTEGEAKFSKVVFVFRWWSKFIPATIPRTRNRNILFSSTRISKIKMINVDRGCSLWVDFQDDLQSASRGDDFQAFVDNSDLIIIYCWLVLSS